MMFDILYIAGCFAGVWVANRLPAPVPRTYEINGIIHIADQRPLAIMTFLCMGIGAAYGGMTAIHDDMTTLDRLTAVIGALCGGYVGLRGVYAWGLMIVVYASLVLLRSVLKV